MRRIAETIGEAPASAKFITLLRKADNNNRAQDIVVEAQNPFAESSKGSERLDEFLALENYVIRTFQYEFPRMSVTISRNVHTETRQFAHPYETIQTTFRHGDEVKAMAYFKAVRQHLRCWDEQHLPDAIGDDLKRYYTVRENNVKQLEDKIGELTTRLAEYAMKNDREVIEKKAQLEEAYQARLAELEEQRKQLLAEAVDRKKELDERAAKINDRENVHERRRLYDEIKKQIQSKSTKPELTAHTQGLRKLVWQLSGGLGVFLLTVFIICFVINLRSESVNWVAVGSQIASGASLLGLAAFTIRWQNRWFEDHSDEEFRLKRMELDIERASWLVELALEWFAETKAPIPQELLDKLATSLFTDGTNIPLDISPLESLRTGMLSKNWKLSVEPGKVEAQSGKNGK
ncbi:hypothetical protein J0H58_13385 [bacterium]|nr:hypothetical protein [bacterium]